MKNKLLLTTAIFSLSFLNIDNAFSADTIIDQTLELNNGGSVNVHNNLIINKDGGIINTNTTVTVNGQISNYGIIDNSGTFEGVTTLTNDGDITNSNILNVFGDVTNNGTIKNTGNLNVNNTFTNSKTIINSGTISNNSSLIFENNSTYILSIANDNSLNLIGGKITGDVILNGDVILKVDLASNTIIGENGYKISNTLVDATNGKWVNNLYNYSFKNNDNSTLTSVDVKSADEISVSTGADKNDANLIIAIAKGGTNSSNDKFNNMADNITSLLLSTNKDDVSNGVKIVDSISVDDTYSVQSTTISSAIKVFNTVKSHLDDNLESNAWINGIVNTQKLDNSNGFKTNSNGFTLGAEKQFGDFIKLGVGYAFINNDIDTSSKSIDGKSNSAILYGKYKPDNWYLDTIATYSFSDYDESSSYKTSSYDVDYLGLQAMYGYDININENSLVNPELGLRYININQKSYTDSLGSYVHKNNSDILTGVVGANLSTTFALPKGVTLSPEIKGALTYDLTDNDTSSLVTLPSNYNYISNINSLERFGAEFSVSICANVTNSFKISLGYEGRFKKDYKDNTGMLDLKYSF